MAYERLYLDKIGLDKGKMTNKALERMVEYPHNRYKYARKPYNKEDIYVYKDDIIKDYRDYTYKSTQNVYFTINKKTKEIDINKNLSEREKEMFYIIPNVVEKLMIKYMESELLNEKYTNKKEAEKLSRDYLTSYLLKLYNLGKDNKEDVKVVQVEKTFYNYAKELVGNLEKEGIFDKTEDELLKMSNKKVITDLSKLESQLIKNKFLYQDDYNYYTDEYDSKKGIFKSEFLIELADIYYESYSEVTEGNWDFINIIDSLPNALIRYERKNNIK